MPEIHEPPVWYSEGDTVRHESGVLLRAVRDPAKRTRPNGAPMLIWQRVEEDK